MCSFAHTRPIHADRSAGNVAPAQTLVGPSSLEDLKPGKLIDGDCGSNPLLLPDWVDLKRYDEVVNFFKRHSFSLTFAWHCSLVIGFSLPSLLTAVNFTHTSDTPKKALQRYMRNRNGQAVAWVKVDYDDDMAIVQTGFMGAVTIVPQKFGLHAADKDLEDYVFFWKCVGHQLGIDDKFNLCSLGKATSDKIVWEVIHEVLLPDIANPPPAYSHTAEAYIGGLNLIFLGLPIFSVKSTLAFSYWALGLQRGPLDFADLCRYLLLRIIIIFIGILPPYRYLLNWSVCRTVLGNHQLHAIPREGRACPFVSTLPATESASLGHSGEVGALTVFPSLAVALLLPILI
eukprot:CAMPEP_0169300168 /NCGR_PEP_ID=MMETSP1016-20121227/67469_1 /TAXON_ID=342587 /ORGANISM="Karlodinium micrum, Strain CCMP2283" /LENGTH=343 /DNA_ID=CAMNT_0009392487 /DNA_START=1 /DNA_END=1030 /DNA_ORIENTATION=+